ncbi:MAG TPA: XRE family transcriptional regulator, partial [Alphaproteobacteria bacterium]|nr:XRE family transcriptional regulator [Alphaproteobacteria bacterium]
MDKPAKDLGERIALRMAELRAARGLSLDALAGASGVSRSMISLIERGESSPSAVVLDKLARALGTGLAAFFDPGAGDGPPSPVARHEDQPCWKDPDSGYRRRNVSPPGVPQPMRIVDIHFPAGARVTFDSPRDDAVQQVWVLGGTLEVTVGEEQYTLH